MAAENFKVKKGLEVGTGITANSDGVNVTGIITATQFKGDGSGLTGVVGSGSGVVIKDEGSAVGTAGTINFVGSGVAATLSAGTATVTINAGGLDNVVEDTTPQLGGNLDLNSKFVTGSGGINVTGVVTATTLKGNGDFVDIDVDGQTEVDDLNVSGIATGTIFKVPDATNSAGATNHIAVGNNSDLKLYHDNNGDAYVSNATGHLTIRNNTAGRIINLQPKSGANGIIARYEGAAELYHNGNLKLTTTINGIEVPDLNVTGVGTVGRLETNGVTLGTNNNTFAAKFIDDAVANFGTDNDLKISHDDTHARITNTKGNIVVSGIISATSDVKVGSAITMDPTSGIITATSFSGSGSGLTSIPSAQLSGALPALDGSALTGITASGSGIIVKHDGSTVGTAGTINFSTNLDVSAISAGIVTVTASGGSIAGISTTGTSVFNEIVVGSGVTLNARGINAVGTAVTAGRFHADGGSFQAQIGNTNQGFYLYNGNSTHLGLYYSSSASSNYLYGTGNQPLIINDFSIISIAADAGAVQLSHGNGLKLTTDQAGVKITGICTATTFSGSGASLTTLNASELDSGTIPNGRFPTTLPAIGGGSLTDLNATALTTGTVPTGRFGTNNISPSSISVTSSRILGRVSSGTNSAEELTAAQVRTLLNVADGATAGITTAPSNVVLTWDVVNQSTSAYRFTGPGQDPTANNPDIYLVRGNKYRFALNASGHPFQIRVSNGGSAYNDGVTNNGAQTGNVEFYVQNDAPASLVYQCTSHGGMVGNIYITGHQLTNGANNRVVTATSAYGMNGESGLTFDGTTLKAEAGNPILELSGTTSNGGNTFMHINANANHWCVGADNYTQQNMFVIKSGTPASSSHRVAIDSYGVLRVGNTHSQGTSGNTKRIALGAKASIWGWTSGNINGALTLSDNYYWDGSNNKAIESDYCAYLSLRSGSMRFGCTAASQTGGQNVSGGIHEKVRFENDGNVSISDGNLSFASGHGIDFSATANSAGTMSSELLDDYEEGTFTPIFYYVSGTSGVQYNYQEGRYTKIGRMVSFQIRMALTNKGSGNYNVRIGGLPYVPSQSGVQYDHFMFSAIVGMNIGDGHVPFAQMEDYSVGRITLYSFDNGSGDNYDEIDSGVISNTFTFGLQGVYVTAS